MVTRAAAALEAAFLSSANAVASTPTEHGEQATSASSSQIPPIKTSKRKRAALKVETGESSNPVVGGWDQLPHNMGTINNTARIKDAENVDIDESASIKAEISGDHDNIELSDGTNTLPSKINKTEVAVAPELMTSSELSELSDSPELSENKAAPIAITTQQNTEQASAETTLPRKRRVAVPRIKKHPYGLTPGASPFPDWPTPTVTDCHNIHDRLTEVHGEVKAPKEIPVPSLEIAGCGEVPSVLDALVRTLLSAATSGTNSNRAFAGLVDRYGLYKSGVGKGSVNWNSVHAASLDDLEDAIRQGGLARNKSRNIKRILDIVYAKNQARRDAFIAEKETGRASNILGADSKTQKQKDLEIEHSDVLSLQYMHGLDSTDAMEELLTLPGIGVKTSSCVILFCLQRPSFAVDTHVWRLCKWLGWVPANATRDQTFSHCEVRVPDELKYGLHQLFIRHGKTCLKCRANTSEANAEWKTTTCPLEEFIKRT